MNSEAAIDEFSLREQIKKGWVKYSVILASILGSIVVIFKYYNLNSILSTYPLFGSLFSALFTILKDESLFQKQQHIELMRQEHDAKMRLQYACIDKRLETHQKSVTLWFELYNCLPLRNPTAIKEVAEACDIFWLGNFFYLDEEVSSCFRVSYLMALEYASILVKQNPPYEHTEISLKKYDMTKYKLEEFYELATKHFNFPPIIDLTPKE